MISSNRELVQRMTEAFSKGDLAAVKDCWAEDIVWHFPGRSRLAGTFHGKEDVLRHLSQPAKSGARM